MLTEVTSLMRVGRGLRHSVGKSVVYREVHMDEVFAYDVCLDPGRDRL